MARRGTPNVTLRIGPDLWQRFGEATDDRSAILRAFVAWYVGESTVAPQRPEEDAVDGKRGPGRPRTGVTPNRTLRVGPVWDDAAAIAAERGETLTSVITRALERYVVRHRAEVPRTAIDGE